MKLLQFVQKHDPVSKARIGAYLDNETVCELTEEHSMIDLITRLERSEEKRSRLEANIQEKRTIHNLSDIQLLPPLMNPEKIICIGLNYHDHVKESNMQVPKVPVLFPKYNNCLIGHTDTVIIPSDVKQCDYEVELAFIIGKTAKFVNVEEAMDYVFGYTILNDVSARDIQLSEPQWTRGKAIDTFAPTGPWIVTADEIPDPHNLDISLVLNGKTMQKSNTGELIFNIPYIISFLSQTMTLQPGDMIITGTPPGVGMGQKPQVWLKEGDVTEAHISGIGVLTNHYVSENRSR
ncbi:fumarylacetoacetate hydrolase family protein [Paenibacillus gansuensis]|uniref:Fumarylacetoacetate hydrolase family protein n=1 Tax=Paenibacillus gansuensis TaxID=306542 RepID=A0ABW5PC59_9BACL